MISAVVVTLNAAKVLKNCLESVKEEAHEIVVVDLGSGDATIKIAREFNAKVIFHECVDYVEKVRNFAVSKAVGEWILVLDPDERVTPDLWEKLKEVIAKNKYMAVNIPRKNIFFGRWIAHTNWWPDRHVRFFKKGKVSWTDKIHHYPLVEGAILNLASREDLAIKHYGYSSIEEFIERQIRYSTIEARDRFELGERFSCPKYYWKPTRQYLVRFIKHLGF